MGSSCLVLRSTARTMVRSSIPSGDVATAGVIWRLSGRLKRIVKGPSGRSLTGSPRNRHPGLGPGAAQSGSSPASWGPRMRALAPEAEAAGAEAGHRRRTQRAAQALLEKLLQFEAAGAGVEAGRHGVNAVGLGRVDVGPVLVDDVADAGARGDDHVGARQN